jgi:Skp family chaperone for outer membrane proteins
MSSIIIGLIAFVCVFGGALLGLFLHNILPDHHLRDDSKDAVKTGVAMIATLAALVLGLLISSSKDSLDSMNTAFTQSGAKIIMLDRVLDFYGPEAKEVREQLRNVVQSNIERIWHKDKTKKIKMQTSKMQTSDRPKGMELILDRLRALTPQNESQRSLQTQALQIGNDLMQSHWLVVEQAQIPLSATFLVILIFWLTILFISSGLFSPWNSTVIIVLLVCAMSVSSAIFLIEDMSRPFDGTMKVSNAPLVKALERLGR